MDAGIPARASSARRAARVACTIGLCAVTGLLPAGLASAQEKETQSADIAAARALAVEGMKLADAGRCEQAIDRLSRAEKLHHSPIVLGRLGECYIAQGRLVDGTELLRRMLREPMPNNPTPAMARAYERAQAALDSAKPQIASVVINVKAPSGVEPVVTIDGQNVPAAVLGAERPTDPGDHVVEATAPGYLKASTKFSVAPGRKHTTELALERDPNAAAEAAKLEETPAPSAAPPSAEAESTTGLSSDFTPSRLAEPPNRTPAYIAWAVGGIGLGVGAGFGIVALSKKSELDDRCQGNTCPADEQDRLDSAKRAGTISTIGFGVGAAGLVLGTVLFFTAQPSDSGSSPRDAARTRPKLRPSASVGLSQVRFSLDF